jgi:hypothetical protein
MSSLNRPAAVWDRLPELTALTMLAMEEKLGLGEEMDQS